MSYAYQQPQDPNAPVQPPVKPKNWLWPTALWVLALIATFFVGRSTMKWELSGLIDSLAEESRSLRSGTVNQLPRQSTEESYEPTYTEVTDATIADIYLESVVYDDKGSYSFMDIITVTAVLHNRSQFRFSGTCEFVAFDSRGVEIETALSYVNIRPGARIREEFRMNIPLAEVRNIRLIKN